MTTFKSFLTEGLQQDFDLWWDTVQRDCKSILSVYKTSNFSYLYRGLKSTTQKFVLNKKINEDRKTVEMPEVIHKAINKASVKNGFPAHRGNSIFCSNKVSIADHWGTPYIIFPVDNFDYTWFKGQSSSYMFNSWLEEADSVLRQYARKVKKKPSEVKEEEFVPVLEEEFEEIFKQYLPQKTNLKACLKSSDTFDILISSKMYHACDFAFIQKLEKAIDSLKK